MAVMGSEIEFKEYEQHQGQLFPAHLSEALDPGDDLCLFDVIEDNGTRLMIRLVCDLPIPPVKVVRRADMCKSQR